MAEADNGIEVRTYFARGRNALVARAEFSEMYAAFYLHQLDWNLRVAETHEGLIRDALAAITLHSAARPRKEICAWTVNFQNPLANVFVTGDNRQGTVVGNVFTENVRKDASGAFHANIVQQDQPTRHSVVNFEGSDFLSAVEHFYRQSEQRPARFFRHDEEDLVMVIAQPDCDLEWMEALDRAAILKLDENEELSLLETRHYRFECGCTQSRMLAMLAPIMRKDPEGLFGDEETLRITCPRCGARHAITREAMEAFLTTEDR